MKELIRRADVVMKEVVSECGLPLAEDKKESIVLQERQRRGKSDLEEKVKLLGVIIDEFLTFESHWKVRVEKGRGLVGAIRRIGGSRCSMRSYRWRVAYNGMVKLVVSWGIEVVWKGQKE